MISLIKTLVFCWLLHIVHSYYFYNAATHQVISIQRLDAPKGFRILSPPKTITVGKAKFTSGLYCQDMGFTCTEKFNYSLTYQFECENDSNCPSSYICCPQKCFNHRVCTKGILKLLTSNNNIKPHVSRQTENSQCKKWPHNCKSPYHIRLTSMYECKYDTHCPNGYKCCKNECFQHKICSEIERKVGVDKLSSNLIKLDIKEVTRKSLPREFKIAENNIERKIETTTNNVERDTFLYEKEADKNEKAIESDNESIATPDPNAIIEDYSELYDEYSENEGDEEGNEDYEDE